MPEKDETEVATEQPEILFAEHGASWLWLLSGPLSGLTMLYLQVKGNGGYAPTLPMMFVVLVTGFVAIQIKANRIHTSVELTRESLREGAQITPVELLTEVYPEKIGRAKPDATELKWVEARALGELSNVPRGRKPIGIALKGGRTARAWARKHRDLRAALTGLLEERGNTK